ncbi:4Fe-4S binding domain-containing protein [Desulfuromusa kysingii]|uniref:4Fe-4S binding domain-containing protein n=1 Tax=Desulfuromusa kysingii TaxID=37625 RepID=A0A1H4BWR3_9BACT|nr:4Fe-4S binding protein [Desulfuromusa kysingii]SEA52578.1 4Fe-4S binding domain-containing protein [Desulfuromusa kysingii]
MIFLLSFLKGFFMRIIVDQTLCCGHAACVKICPENAISLIAGKATIDASKCTVDGLCIPACPHGAIEYDDDYAGGVGCGF